MAATVRNKATRKTKHRRQILHHCQALRVRRSRTLHRRSTARVRRSRTLHRKSTAQARPSRTLHRRSTARVRHPGRRRDKTNPVSYTHLAAENILRHLGCRTHWEQSQGSKVLCIHSEGPFVSEIPDQLMREMRSSIVFLGAMIARCGQAKLSYPGGCELGPRPIDLHLSSLKKLGVTIREDGGRCV